MADEKELKLAQQVYETLCQTLDDEGWRYTRNEDELSITTGVKGEDLPIDLTIKVYPENQILSLMSHLPTKAPEDKRVDIAMAVNIANHGMVWGGFDYNILTGNLLFRVATGYHGCELGKEAIKTLVYVACFTVDKYNDKFLMLAKNLMTLEQFLQSEKQ